MDKWVKAKEKQGKNEEEKASSSSNIHKELPPNMVGECNGFQSKKYFFTYHIKQDDSFDDAFKKIEGLKKLCVKYIWGEEYGEEGNTPHLQGGFVLKKKMYAKTIQNKYFKNGVTLRKLKSWDASKIYCSKECNKIVCSDKIRKPVKDYFDRSKIRDFQKTILKIISMPPKSRKIYWLWESYGGVGKTTLARHICLNYNALYIGGKNNDIKFAVSQYVNKRDLDVVIVNLPLSQKDNAPYDALEEIKDGIFFSSKYESGMCIFNIPHIIVFANFPPKNSINGRIQETCIENFDTSSEELMFELDD